MRRIWTRGQYVILGEFPLGDITVQLEMVSNKPWNIHKWTKEYISVCEYTMEQCARKRITISEMVGILGPITSNVYVVRRVSNMDVIEVAKAGYYRRAFFQNGHWDVKYYVKGMGYIIGQTLLNPMTPIEEVAEVLLYV